jgi:hypothetical protein
MPKLFAWSEGRQQGTEYKKFCFLYTKIGKVGMDGYILKYEPNTILPPHTDKLNGKHYRLNIELFGKGKFICEKKIISIAEKVFLFRPDLYEHSVVNYDKTRYVLSFGLAIFN